jgi:hypothetical protein
VSRYAGYLATQGWTLVSKRRRESLKTHKQIGKRWSLLASHLRIGILLTCDPSLATYM